MATLDIYKSPFDDGDYIASIEVPDEIPAFEGRPIFDRMRTIVILDRSGSMGQSVKRVLQINLPQVFEILGYPPNYTIDLLTFDSVTEHYQHKVHEFPTLPYVSRGSTQFQPAIVKLGEVLESFPIGTYVRILTISDGEVWDCQQSVETAEKLAAFLKGRSLDINSQAVRLFTSTYGEPDTRALSTVLQFSTTSVPNLVDLKSTNYETNSELYAHLFQNDEFSYRNMLSLQGTLTYMMDNELLTLPSDHHFSIFKPHPWADRQATLMLPKQRRTLFWIPNDALDVNAIPTTNLSINEQIPVTITYHATLNYETYKKILSDRIKYYMMQAKLLCVVGGEASKKQLEIMSDSFHRLESSVIADSVASDEDSASRLSLKTRLTALKERIQSAEVTISQRIRQLANVDSIGKFNSAQSAAFLRGDASANEKSSRGLVRRAGTDLNFDEILQNEIFAMSKQKAELEKIDDSDHKASFTSLATTLDGIHGLIELCDGPTVEDSTISKISAFEIISLANIVGVPVMSKTGDYPDPFQYNIRHVYVGNYASLSDIIAAKDANATLTIPGLGPDATFDDVIPVFDSFDLYRFVYTHAPSLLSYSSSVGMRRVIADIPMTLQAQLVVGLIKLLRILDSNRSEVVISTIKSIYSSIMTSLPPQACGIQVEGIANSINNYRAQQAMAADELNKLKSEGRTPVLTGLEDLPTTMMVPAHTFNELFIPLLRIYAKNEVRGVENVTEEELAAFSRALYNREIWAVLRSLYRGKADAPAIIRQHIDQLIGYSDTTQPTALFEANIPFEQLDLQTSFPGADAAIFKQLSNRFQHLHIITQLHTYHKLFTTEPLDVFKDYNVLPRLWHQDYRSPVVFDQRRMNDDDSTSPEQDERVIEYYQYLEYYNDHGYYVTASGETRNEAPAVPTADKLDRALNPAPTVNQDAINQHTESIIPFYNLAFNLDMETAQQFSMFQYIQVVLAFIYYDNQYRSVNTVSLLPDTVSACTFRVFETALDAHRIRLHKTTYETRLKVKQAEEDDILSRRLAHEIATTEPLPAAINLWRTGITQGVRQYILQNAQSAAFKQLYKLLIDDTDYSVKLRLEKLRILVLAREYGTDEPVWNDGEVVYIPKLDKIARVFTRANSANVGNIPEAIDWNIIQATYRANRKHNYRLSNLPNRHQHRTTKPSYFALGFTSFEEFEQLSDPKDVQEYRLLHVECCGLGSQDVRKSRIKHWNWDDDQLEQQNAKRTRRA